MALVALTIVAAASQFHVEPQPLPQRLHQMSVEMQRLQNANIHLKAKNVQLLIEKTAILEINQKLIQDQGQAVGRNEQLAHQKGEMEYWNHRFTELNQELIRQRDEAVRERDELLARRRHDTLDAREIAIKDNEIAALLSEKQQFAAEIDRRDEMMRQMLTEKEQEADQLHAALDVKSQFEHNLLIGKCRLEREVERLRQKNFSLRMNGGMRRELGQRGDESVVTVVGDDDVQSDGITDVSGSDQGSGNGSINTEDEDDEFLFALGRAMK